MIFTKDIVLSIIAYVPAVGWILPLYLAKDRELSQFHGKQGLLLNITFFYSLGIWWLISNIIPISHSFIEDYILYFIIIIYAILLVWGELTVIYNNLRLPYYSKKAQEINL